MHEQSIRDLFYRVRYAGMGSVVHWGRGGGGGGGGGG
jgi:hypothetical protein